MCVCVCMYIRKNKYIYIYTCIYVKNIHIELYLDDKSCRATVPLQYLKKPKPSIVPLTKGKRITFVGRGPPHSQPESAEHPVSCCKARVSGSGFRVWGVRFGEGWVFKA